MKRFFCAATALCTSLLVATACQEPDSNTDVGSIRANLAMATGVLDVRGIRFDIVGPDGVTRTKVVDLIQGGIGAADPTLRDQWFADWLLSVPTGRNRVRATPVRADGANSRFCPPATGVVVVMGGATSELSMVSDCTGSGTGGIDVSVALNQPPVITDLSSPTGKFLCWDQPFVANLRANDPDGDPITWTWTVVSTSTAFPNVQGDHCLNARDGDVVFAATIPGRYELRATVSDGRTSTGLTFPVYIDNCRNPTCPGQLVASVVQTATPSVTLGQCTCAANLPTVNVTPNVVPQTSVIPGSNPNEGARAVERYQAPSGRTADFVANELLVMTDDTAALTALANRWGGTVLSTIDFTPFGVTNQPAVHRVRIDLSRADPSVVPLLWSRHGRVTGTQLFSSTTAVSLFAAALGEIDQGMSVGLNFIAEGSDFPSRSTQEEPVASDPDYVDRDAYQWPYMNRASEQDIGTGESWTNLFARGRLGNRVRMAIVDGGFRVNTDFPASTVLNGVEGVPNPMTCTGGRPCLWHGTHVAMSAAAEVNNGEGVAGPAGPVADLLLLQTPAPDFFAIIDYVVRQIPRTIGARPQIVNFSGGFKLPAEACLTIFGGVPLCETLHGLTAGLRASGMLIFAAAGNEGDDVDATKTFGICPFCGVGEAEIVVPCELNGVVCVGGLDWNSNRKHPASRWGSKPSDGQSVDIYGPYDVFGVVDPAAADDSNPTPDLTVMRVGGTSFSTPYVAGVAALIWASNPALTAAEVENILLTTAHTDSSDTRVGRWVNSYAGVLTAAGRNRPPFLRILTPRTTLPAGVPITLEATVEELDGEAYEVVWRRGTTVIARGDRVVNVPTTSWAIGNNTITAQATDSRGNASAVDSVIVTLNGAPTRTVGVPILPLGAMCPIGPDAGGSDFNGAPTIAVDGTLRIAGGGNSVVASIEWNATGPSGAFVTHTFERTLYNAPMGVSVVAIDSPTTFAVSVRGRAGGFELTPFGCNDGVIESISFPAGAVASLSFIADTGGDDISSDSDCACDSRLESILFRPLQLRVTP